MIKNTQHRGWIAPIPAIGTTNAGVEMSTAMVFAMLIHDYVTGRADLGELSPASADVIRYTLLSFAGFVGPLEMAELAPADVRRWIASSRRQPATIKSMLGKVRPFARWCVENGHCERDFTAGIRSPKVPDGLPRSLEQTDCSRVISSCPDDRARVVILLMLHCGLRIGEVARLRVGDIDVRRRSLGVRGKGGRGRVTRFVPVPDECWRELRRFVGARRSGAVVLSYQPPHGHLKPASLSALVREWMTDAGIKSGAWDGVSAHACRHTTAQDLVDAGHNLRIVQTLLGHRSVRTTEDYTRRDPPGLRQATEGRNYI